jgi:hypothetical protein
MRFNDNISDRNYSFCFSILCILVFLWVAFRAYHLSITYDEVWVIDLTKQSIYDMFTAPRNFTSANHLILNTFLAKPCIHLFGTQEWVIRLPNVIAFIIFLISSKVSIDLLTKNNTIRLVGLLIVNLQLYQLDFFSLSRGYGLASAFQMLSLALALMYLTKKKYPYYIFSFVSAAHAVLANFTWLNYFVALGICMIGIELYQGKKYFLLTY